MSPHADLIAAGVPSLVIVLIAVLVAIWVFGLLLGDIRDAIDRHRRAVEWQYEHANMKPYKPNYEAIRTLQQRLKR